MGASPLQEPQRLPPLSHQAWSTEEGLPDASVHQVLQSRDGYLWLATEGGVARFDGSEFTVLRHSTQPAFSSDDVRALAQDSAGDLWFGTADGLLRFHNQALQRFTTAEGLPDNRVTSLAATSSSSLLVLTAGGPAQRMGGRFVPLAAGESLPALQVTASDTVQGVTTGDPLVFEHGQLQRTGPPHEGSRSASRAPMTANFDARSLTLLGPGGLRTFHAGQDLPAGRILAAQIASSGRLWIGTTRGLFSVAAGAKGRPQAIPALGNDAILCLYEDREGNLWIGTEASGLHVLRPRKFRVDPTSAGEPTTAVLGLSEDQAWYGTRENGLHHIDHGVAAGTISPEALTSAIVLSLAAGRHGDLWAGTPDGLDHVEGSHVQHLTSADGLPDDFVRSLLVDRRGVVWAGTRGGLARVEAGRLETRSAADGLGSDSIGPLLQLATASASTTPTGDDLWAGTSQGLSHVHGKHIETFAPSSQVNSSIITALAQTGNGEILVAVHQAGLLFFRDGHFSRYVLPLAADVNSMVYDGAGWVWLRGARSVSRVSVAAMRACAAEAGACHVQQDTCNTADGLPNDASAEGSPQLSLSPDGTLWIATRKGLATADLPQLPVNRVPPPVVLQHLLIDGTEIPLPSGNLSIGPGHSRFLFSFAALSYTLPARVRYRYRLEGLDHDWIDAGSSHSASYTSLPPRHYRFVVQAQNNDGVWDTQDASVTFRILPPFYRRWWFGLLVLLTAALLAFSLLRLRERVVKRRFSVVLGERNRLAREIHDTLAQDFVSISLQLDIASSLLRAQQVDAATEQLQDIRALIKEGLQAARQSIWNLRASAGEDSLPTRLSALAARYSFPGGPPGLRVGGAFRPLPHALEAEVLRIAGESLSNASRHAHATTVEISLFYQPDELQLTVRDDGQGFSLAEAAGRHGHYGLRGLRERAADLGGKLMIASSPGEGTTVALTVPLGKESQLT